MRVWISGTLLLLLGWGAAFSQEPVPVGEEFQVNTYTTDVQGWASVDVEADGDFVIVWYSEGSGGSDTSSWSIQGQRFSSAGDPVDTEFQVNSYTSDSQLQGTVALDLEGRFVVVWQSNGSNGDDTSLTSIQGQRFDAVGATIDDEFQVNSYTNAQQKNSAVAVVPDGGFVIVWDSADGGGSDTWYSSIQGQRFDSAGAPTGDEFQINTYTTNTQDQPSVAINAEGDFVVVWQSMGSYGSDTSHKSIQGQRYDAAGNPLGGEFQVNSYTTFYQRDPMVAVDPDGNFVVVWKTEDSDGPDTFHSIQGQRFDSAGAPTGDEFQINSYTPGGQIRPSVAMDSRGGFVVVWQSDGSNGGDNSFSSIQGQRFDTAGNPLGAEFQVNSYTPYNQESPTVAMNSDGDIVVAWHSHLSNGPDEFFSIQGQRFALPLFADGFESGDTSAWSRAVP